jgi:hypothetical protein
LVIYIGQPSETNFRWGLDHKIWGFRNNRAEYGALRPGDFIVFGVRAIGGGPRVGQEEWATNTLSEVFLGRLTSGLFVDEDPLWPDENEELSYPYRVQFELLDRETQVPLVPGDLGPAIIAGLRSAGLVRQGVVTDADGALIEEFQRQAQVVTGGARSAENVWLEIQDKCRQNMAMGTPILTLDREIPNHIVAVEDKRILRRSDKPQSEEGGGPTKAEIIRLWNALVDEGEVGKGRGALFFAYALIARLIDGVAFDKQPFRLFFADRERAMRPWVSTRSADTALLDRIGDMQRSQQSYGPAPHKPLLLLVALARLQRGESRLAPFAQYEPVLRDLLVKFVPGTADPSPELPFWHLQTDGLWEVIGPDGRPLTQEELPIGDPPTVTLRQDDVVAGIPEVEFNLLKSDELLLAAAAQLLLECLPGKNNELTDTLGLALPDEATISYKDYALRRIGEAIGYQPAAEAPGTQTYVLRTGRKLHLRTMKRNHRSDTTYSYWFGLREPLWVSGDIFVLQCGLSGTLVVPVDDWLPYREKIPLAKAGTNEASREPQIWRSGRKFEFRVADESRKVLPEGILDARRWLDGFAHLQGPEAHPVSVKPSYWWVNQGKNYALERDGAYLFAGKTTKGGAVISMHSNVGRLRPGDVIFHYSQGAIRAVSAVRQAGVEGTRPAPNAGDQGTNSGYLAGADYYELAEPIQLNAVPLEERVNERGPFMSNGGVKQGYLFPLTSTFGSLLRDRFPSSWPPGSPLAGGDLGPEPEPVVEPSFEDIETSISQTGLRIDQQTLRRYHLSVRTRGFVILTGLSGTGKTWLADAYAQAVSAERLIVPVAPNWTTNEDLLGYFNPLDNTYHDTPFSNFLRTAATEYVNATALGLRPRPYHLILDEMNLARVEYYFAKFLSAMEIRARQHTASIELAPGEEVLLTPNLIFVGTVNVDETTHGFADKVYDRAQLIELTVSHELLEEFVGDMPWQSTLLSVWDALVDAAPFAFRVVDEIRSYIQEADQLGVPWDMALDEQLLQKVLPKVKGVDPRVGDGLQQLMTVCGDRFPLTRTKTHQMLQAFKQHGFVSFF